MCHHISKVDLVEKLAAALEEHDVLLEPDLVRILGPRPAAAAAVVEAYAPKATPRTPKPKHPARGTKKLARTKWEDDGRTANRHGEPGEKKTLEVR